MALYIDPDLKDFLRREDSYAEYAVEISAPDVDCVLRRAADQFFTAPPLVSPNPLTVMSESPSGGLELTPTPLSLASASGSDTATFGLATEDPTNRMKGILWTVGKSFARARIRNFKATIQKDPLLGTNNDFSLQIYRITQTPGVMENYNAQKNQYFTDAFTDYVFTPLLSTAPVIKAASIPYVGFTGTLNFDLSGYALYVENTPVAASSAGTVGELPVYLFVLSPIGLGTVTGRFHWFTDTSGPKVLGDTIGTFQRSWWGRGPGYTGDNSGQQWVPTNYNDCPSFEIDIDTYAASAQAIYALDQGRAPTAGTTGRAVLEQQLPNGTSATLELSTAGATGPWTVYKNGDPIGVAQREYWARLTLTSDAAGRSSANISGFGVEFRVPYDVSQISVLSLPNRDVSLPDNKASIADATLRLIRDGERDYLDTATVIGSTTPTSKLEADIFLRSRHPIVFSDRSKWLRMERLAVDDREPNKVSETLSLLSISKKLKVKVPPLLETVNTVHTVTSSTGTAVDVSPSLVGTVGGGHDYNGLGYYMRVRSSTANIPSGFLVTIAGSTGTNELDFNTGDLPNALAAGDVVEVHSGIVSAEPMSWQDKDPADVWYDIFVAAGFPTDRIGSGDLPRSGFPPRATDFAPGDATTQGKRLVTMSLTQQENADELLDQISFIMGGATVERNGQMVFVQIYPGRALDGTLTVPLAPVAAVFDARDIVANTLRTNPQITSRLVTVTSAYGVNNAAADPTLYPTRTTNATDADALAWLTQQDLEFVGAMNLDDNISRWLYNTNDAGQYLASVVCAQVVRGCSTGIRNFPFQLREKYPEVQIGDSVVVITDQYTDYDPALGVPIAGMIALKGVVVHTGSGGGDFSIFVGGLSDNVQHVGGRAGTQLAGDLQVSKTDNGDGTYSISWGGSGVTLSLDGADPVTPPASPIVVAQDLNDHIYVFAGFIGGAVAVESIDVPAVFASGPELNYEYDDAGNISVGVVARRGTDRTFIAVRADRKPTAEEILAGQELGPGIGNGNLAYTLDVLPTSSPQVAPHTSPWIGAISQTSNGTSSEPVWKAAPRLGVGVTPKPTVSLSSVSASSSSITDAITLSPEVARVDFFITTAPPSSPLGTTFVVGGNTFINVVDVEAIADLYTFIQRKNDGTYLGQLTFPVPAPGWILYVTAVPTDAMGQRGPSFNWLEFALDTSTTPPHAITLAAPSATATSVSSVATIPSSGTAVSKVRILADGAFFADVAAVGAGLTQTLTATGLKPGVSHTIAAIPLAADGTPGPTTTAAPINTSAATLVAPTGLSTGWSYFDQAMRVNFTPNAGDPSGTQYHILRSTTSGGTYSDIGNVSTASPALSPEVQEIGGPQTFWYKIQAVDPTGAYGSSSPSTNVSGVVPLGKS